MSELSFDASKLGTKQYWEHLYNTEVVNFQDHGDHGEIWFGETVEDRMLNWILRYCEQHDHFDPKVLDVGCGNGHLLLQLHEHGLKHMTGVDYSRKAIDLANFIASSKSIHDINFMEEDVLSDQFSFSTPFDIILDKGTFDAIALMENPESFKLKYIKNLRQCIKENGIFLITSCNWTKDELTVYFTGDWEYHDHVQYPEFSFGGKKGTTVSTVAFRPKSNKN